MASIATTIHWVPNRFEACSRKCPFSTAAVLMETLSAWGGNQFLFVGWCGAIDPTIQTGDILLPTSAFVDEGTSRCYDVDNDQAVLPPGQLHQTVKRLMQEKGLPFHEGAIWSTDAVFRETPSKVSTFREQGALAVEMEISACLTVARLRKIQFAVQERSLCELAGLGYARTKPHRRVDQQRHDHRAAVTVQLEHRLTRERRGRRKIQGDSCIELIATSTAEAPVRGSPGFR